MQMRAHSNHKKVFANDLMSAMRQMGEHRPLGYSPAKFAIFLRSNPKQSFCLDTVFEEYQVASSECREALLQQWARTWNESQNHMNTPLGIAQVRSALMPRIADRTYLNHPHIEMRATNCGMPNIPFRVIGRDLALWLVLDNPYTISWASEELLSSLGYSLEQALFIAKENLRKRSTEDFICLAPGTHRSPWRDNYDASRLILPDVIGKLHVRGMPIAAIPNRNTLLITGSDDLDGIALLADEILGAIHQPRYDTGCLVCLAGDEWVPYLPAENSPLYGCFKDLQLETKHRQYVSQADFLRRREKSDCVAGYMRGREHPTGKPISVCVWAMRSCPVLLPRTEYIAFAADDLFTENDGLVACGRWDDFYSVVGDLMQPQGFYPERYLITRSPSPEQKQALARNVPLFQCRLNH